jgi:hypothetical protein
MKCAYCRKLLTAREASRYGTVKGYCTDHVQYPQAQGLAYKIFQDITSRRHIKLYNATGENALDKNTLDLFQQYQVFSGTIKQGATSISWAIRRRKLYYRVDTVA